MSDIDISDLDAGEVLAELYNAAGSPGLGVLQRTPDDMSAEEGRAIMAEQVGRFDYLKGRVLKVDLNGGVLRFARLYDRDNGEGAAQAAVDRVRARKAVAK